MASFVQGAFAYSGATSVSYQDCPYDSNVVAGNLLVVAFGWASATPATDPVSDTQGNTWTLVEAMYSLNSGLIYSAGIAYAIANASGANTVRVTPTVSTARVRVGVHEYGDADTLDQKGHATGISTLVQTPTFTTTHAIEVIFGWLISQLGVTSANSPYTLRENVGSETTCDYLVTTTGDYAPNGPTSNTTWMAIGATFYDSGGSGPLNISADSTGQTLATAGGGDASYIPPLASNSLTLAFG